MGNSRIVAYSLLVLACALGLVSLMLCGVFLWAGPRHIADLSLGTPMALVFDGLLCLAFFLQHSGMVRRSFRLRLAAVLPTHYYPAVYAIASGIVLLLLLVLWQPSRLGVFSLEGPPRWLARGVSLAAITGFAWAIGSLGQFDPFGRGPILAHLRGVPTPAMPLTIRGPYRWVRHPFYASGLLFMWTHPDLTADRLLFDVLVTIWVVVGTLLEERDLAAEFGEAYVKYQRSVPMLVPWRLRPRV